MPARFWIIIFFPLAGALSIFMLSRSLDAAVISLVAAIIALAISRDGSRAIATSAHTEPGGDEERSSAEIARTAALIAAMPIPVLIVGNGCVAEANLPAVDLLGAHIPGEDVRLAIRNPAALALISGPSATTTPASIEMVGLGGAEQRWALRIVPLSPSHMLLALSDESGRYAAERMRVDFVANASHELRTPLAGILGFIETLRDPVAGADAATRERFLSIMDGEARRMQRLVDDLMSLSRIEADKYRAPEDKIALAPLIGEIADIFRNRTDFQGRPIEIEIADNLPPVRGDRPQLSQLIHNLIGNALKYGAPATPVTVSLKPAGRGEVRLSVTDRGEGIAPEHLPRLTERFYRVDSSRSRAMGGTGLGLAIVKHIVERHRGRLDISSTVGTGTTVIVDLSVFTNVEMRMPRAQSGAMSQK
jgi:two-component system phosphate regulon sensor histidine kinase PhoR